MDYLMLNEWVSVDSIILSSGYKDQKIPQNCFIVTKVRYLLEITTCFIQGAILRWSQYKMQQGMYVKIERGLLSGINDYSTL